MTSTTHKKKRLDELERTNGPQEGQIDVWRVCYVPAGESDDAPSTASAFGPGWTAQRRDQETEKEFEARCISRAKQAGHDISFEQ